MADYADWEKQTSLHALVSGVGDHGGGPTRDMLEVQNVDSLPSSPLEFSTAQKYLQHINST